MFRSLLHEPHAYYVAIIIFIGNTYSRLEEASELRQHDTIERNADQRVHHYQNASAARRRVQVAITC